MPSTTGWFRKNWTTPVLLLVLFLGALYLRAYYPLEIALPQGDVSGGSDAFYYGRIIDHIAESGQYLVQDPRLNFPMGLENVRPPLYAWTTAVAGMVAAPLFPNTDEAIAAAIFASTAVWGALTIFPMYFLGKEAFGRRVGLLAAFLLSVMPAHLQRSPATNGDHDAMVLFFVVTGFYFFLRSLKTLHEKQWVATWSPRKAGRASIAAGLKAFVAENRTSVLYALLAGWCMAAIALTWQGWAYAVVILLVYFLFQILVHRLRNQDPMGILVMFSLAMLVPLLVSIPWYWAILNQRIWWIVPAVLFVSAFAIGLVFTVTRDYPWALVVPSVIAGSAIALIGLSFLVPAFREAFASGLGYFIQNKAYETIAEAQPPGLSQVMLSFGITAYFLALFGLLWMMRGIPKHPTPDYLFVVVWAVAAIFMAQAAARFIFNAAPAFAMAGAWVTILLVDYVDFDGMRRTFRSFAAKPWTAFRRSVRVRHVLGSLTILFVLLLPIVWYGVDASIPFERKSEFDRQVYNLYPDFLKPEGYAARAQGGGTFFFGAFGYSVPSEKEYFPAMWRWFRGQDADIHPVENRPAFLSWWDYGFEAVNVGDHPTVADNFLDGYHLAGNFIMAQSEADAVALLNMRLLEGDFRENVRENGIDAFRLSTRAALGGLGIPAGSIDSMEDAFRNPSAYVPIVSADPHKYRRTEGLQPGNAQYIFGIDVLTEHLDADELAELNHALRQIVGGSIRYFAVDTRLFPLDGENTGIFYAPAKLSDHRILTLADGRSLPIDFFNLRATTQRGVIDIAEVLPTDQVSDLAIVYKDMFYNSMFYRAYAGFPPSVAGQTCNDCIPGLPSPTNQQMVNIPPMQAWNLSHFKLVYRTAYYNPFPADQVANHTDEWRALEAQEAEELQGKINRGEATGVVDANPGTSMRRGMVVLKYYDGAFVNGTLTLDRERWPGVRVTVHDELGIPHDTDVTDANGRYSVIAPFGKAHVQFTVGTPDSRTLSGPTTVHEFEVDVSDAAAMRENVDENGDGVLDWLIPRDVAVDGEVVSGILYLDSDRDGRFDPTELRMSDATIAVRNSQMGISRTASTASDGGFRLEALYPAAYETEVVWDERTLALPNVTVSKGQGPADVAVTPQDLRGFVLDAAGRPIADALVSARDLTNRTTLRATTTSNGSYLFSGVLPGTFEIVASEGSRVSLPLRATFTSTFAPRFTNVTIYPAATLSGRTSLSGLTQGFVTFTFDQRSAARLVRVVTSDANGDYSVSLPQGTWDVHGRHFAGTSLWAIVGSVSVSAGEIRTFPVSFSRGASVGGLLFDSANRSTPLTQADLVFRSPVGETRVRTDTNGRFLTYLPLGTWTLQVSHLDYSFSEGRTIGGDVNLEIGVSHGVLVDGTVLRDFGAASVSIDDPIPDVTVRFFDATRTFEGITRADGTFSVGLPPQGRFSLQIARLGFETVDKAPLSAFEWQTVNRHTLVARNVTMFGELTLDGAVVADGSLVLTFRGLSPGTIDGRATLDGAGGYSVTLAPGRYLPELDRDLSGTGDVRLQIRDLGDVNVPVASASIPRDLALAVRVQVDGTVRLDGQPRSSAVRFRGPEERSVNATGGSFRIFLARGTYTVLAEVAEGGKTYVVFESLTASSPSVISLSLVQATNVTGTVAFSGSPVGDVPVSFHRPAGGTVTATSDAFGQYHVFLTGGTYDATVDHRATAVEASATRHVRYTFSGTVTVVQDSTFNVFAVNLQRGLDNTTVSGTVRLQGVATPAEITFLARGASGLNATASSGSDGQYSVVLQPGTYDVHAVSSLRNGVFLATFELEAEATVLDLDLQAPFRVTGVSTIRTSVRSAANITFTAPLGTAAVQSDGSGMYEIFLPASTYTVAGIAVGTERGIAVTYRTTKTLVLAQTEVLNLPLEKVVRGGVEVTWDTLQRARVAPRGIADYSIQVRNTGNEDETYTFDATTEGFTFSFGVDDLFLPFGSSGNQATVAVAITAAADARVDHSPISVTVRSTRDSATVDSVVLELDVDGFRGLQASVGSAAPVWDGRFLNYTLEIRNAGNAPETFRVTLPNLDELSANGWRASLVGPTGAVDSALEIRIGSNATERPVLRLEKAGGSSGTLARVRVTNVAAPQFESLINVNVQMPVLVAEGAVRSTGTNVQSQEPGIDLATASFLVSLGGIVAAAAYLAFLRRRSR